MNPTIQKNQTVKRDYHITIAAGGKTQATVTVRAEGVRDALKQAYNKICGWQTVDAEELGE